MFRFRVYAFQKDTLLAVSDEELIGRSVKRGKVEVHISEQFYGTDVASPSELRTLLQECTVANLMGERCVALARDLGLVADGNVIVLDDIPHAQIARMR